MRNSVKCRFTSLNYHAHKMYNVPSKSDAYL